MCCILVYIGILAGSAVHIKVVVWVYCTVVLKIYSNVSALGILSGGAAHIKVVI